LVRDQYGTPLTASGVEVTLETMTGALLTTVLNPGTGAGVNYRLEVPVDAGLTADAYLPTAMQPTAPFRMRVKMGSKTYVPMEMKLNLAKLGQAAQSSRIDMTLGEDSDGDGLPDAWELAMIQTGRLKMSLSEFGPGLRVNGNAMTVMEAYVAGTYAWDPSDGFRLDMIGRDERGSVVEFMALRGRSYTITGSDDLKTWLPVVFSVQGSGGKDSRFFQTNQLSRVRVVVPSGPEEAKPRFFRLHVN
jgi:hypothetical protein